MKYLLLILISSNFYGSFQDSIKFKIFNDFLNAVSEEERSTHKLNEINFSVKNFDLAKGLFSDLNYIDGNNVTWGPKVHLSRLLFMARAYHYPSHPFYKNQYVISFLKSTMKKWKFDKYVNHNWWMNEIGLPQYAIRLYFLLEKELNEATKKNLIRLTEQSFKFSTKTGQNLVWYSELFIQYGAAVNDQGRIKLGAKNISNVIRYRDDNERDGLSKDNSFYQHGHVFYNGGYGLGFSKDISRFILILEDTPYKISDKKLEIIFDYVINGQFWLTRGSMFNYSASGREYARYYYSAKKLLQTCKNLVQLESKYKEVFKNCIHSIKNNTYHHLNGFKYFKNGEFIISQNKKGSISTKMFAKHVLNADTTPNSEGLYNYYISDGMNYIFRDGSEYKQIFPIWDYRRLPGTTETKVELEDLPDQRTYGHKEFVGAVTSKNYALASMDFLRGKHIASSHYRYLSKMDFNKSKLQAKKSWFYIDDFVVALGAGINHSGSEDHQVWSSLDQAWAKKKLYFKRLDSNEIENLTYGKVITETQWINHNEVAYVNLEPKSKYNIQILEQTGSWWDISRNRGKDKISGNVFSAWIEHGMNPKNQSYAYIIAPSITWEETDSFIKKNSIKILANNKNIQAIENKNSLMAALYSSGEIHSSMTGLIKASKGILIIVKRHQDFLELNISKPDAYKAELVTIQLEGNFQCDRFCKSKKESTKLKLMVNKGTLKIKLKFKD